MPRGIPPLSIPMNQTARTKKRHLRVLMAHPDSVRNRYDFIQDFREAARLNHGIVFVERWQFSQIAIVVTLPVVASLIVGVTYSVFERDPIAGFTIAGACPFHMV